jgi:DNA invertase Pin-like site-specific DNA recombinase
MLRMQIGYARVSTVEQDTNMQLQALRRHGVKLIFSESCSSVGKRPELARALAAARSGDTLVVYKLDRLARSLKDLLRILDELEAKKAAFRSLTEPVDTTIPAGRMMMQMLGAVAEFERNLIRERSIEGQQAARARGHEPGRPRAMDPFIEAEVVNMYMSGWYTYELIAKMLDVSESSVKRAIYRVTKPGHSSLK